MISLCCFTKNEENCINNMINSVYDFVSEIVVVDTGSTDKTISLIEGYKNIRIYKIGFSDFGSIRTITSHLARKPWILMLDADETLENPHQLFNLTQNYQQSAYAFPRKRWLDLKRTKQTEIEAYPDWQVRFYRNHPNFIWKRELHEYFEGSAVEHIPEGPIIHHFQDVYKDAKRLRIRNALYNELALKAKVTVHGGKPC